jgi:hypothetical protein
VSDVRVFCGGCLVVGVPSHADEPEVAARIAGHPAFAGWQLVVLTDEPARAVKSVMNFLWTTFTGSSRRQTYTPQPPASFAITWHTPAHPDRCADEGVVPERGQLPARRGLRRCRGGGVNISPARGVEMGDSERGHLD